MFWISKGAAKIAVDDMADHYFGIQKYLGTGSVAQLDTDNKLGVNDADTVINNIGSATISPAGVKSVHLNDDATDYQNSSSKDAYALLTIRATGAGVTSRTFKIYSAPTTDSVAGATEIMNFVPRSAQLNASGQTVSTILLKIQPNHFIVIQNNTVGLNNDIDSALFVGVVVERG